MTDYDVYFEFYGKKLKTTVQAESRFQAMEIVRKKIVFIKVAEKEPDLGDFFSNSEFEKLKKILGL